MKKIIGSVLFLLLFPLLVFPQEEKQNPFRLKITGTISAYTDECKINGQNQLVDLEKTIPSIQLDIRYATHDNFTHRQVYKSAKAYLRKPAAAALSAVQQELSEKGLGLKVYDAYRPYSATILFYDLVRDTLFVASPAKGSRHNRGCAVDVSLIDLKTGVELAMPTAFDDFSARAGAFYADLPVIAKENRKTLIEAMKKQGFDVFDSEWWHFDFQGWQAFSLMDISFEELEQP
jgi:D-alanyl-D-alanine dipeptidase